MSALKRYSTTMIVLHWTLAVFILAALFLGAIVLDKMENTNPQKILLLSTHVIVGAGILLFTLLRLFVRLTRPQPAQAPNVNKIMELTATGVHYLLYLFTILTTIAGLRLAIAADLPAILFSHVGVLPKDFESYPAHELHDIFAMLLLATIGLHVAAALFHQFILKDSLFSRMWLSKEK
ncbi:MAG: cytochrome b [Gallionellaceae bacterium]|jgi:cytochrome b561